MDRMARKLQLLAETLELVDNELETLRPDPTQAHKSLQLGLAHTQVVGCRALLDAIRLERAIEAENNMEGDTEY